MGMCGERGVALAFLTENGHFLARVHGPVQGNVLLRRAQYRMADDEAGSAVMARAVVLAKVANCRTVLQRALRDKPDKADGRPTEAASEEMERAVRRLGRLLEDVAKAGRWMRSAGMKATRRAYIFGFRSPDHGVEGRVLFHGRNRRPPLDNVNALLSFVYTLLTHDITAALEGVGLDPAVGYLHRDRRPAESRAGPSLEELRPVIADRLVLSLINRRQVRVDAFRKTESGGVAWMMRRGRMCWLLIRPASRKRSSTRFLGEKVGVRAGAPPTGHVAGTVHSGRSGWVSELFVEVKRGLRNDAGGSRLRREYRERGGSHAAPARGKSLREQGAASAELGI